MIEQRDEAKEMDRAYLCSFPQNTTKKRLIYILKERWCTEAAYQESKGQLGMDQYQGRLYTGLQHHLSSMICTYAFIVAERERQERNGNPGKRLMVRTADIPQRHSPTSIATPRKRIANAVTPWFLAAFPTRPRRRSAQASTDVASPLANGAGGWPGGPGRFPTRGSHRSGLAELPHPARRVTGSLRNGGRSSQGAVDASKETP